MPPAALSTLYCEADDVVAFVSQEAADLRLDDDDSQTVNATELTYLATYAANIATSKINDYALGRYAADQLADSWTARDWAIILASHWLAARRYNAVPKSIVDLRREVLEDLKNLKSGQYMLADISERVVNSPRWKNMRVVDRYRLRKIRVERPISDTTPTRLPEATDLVADMIGPEI